MKKNIEEGFIELLSKLVPSTAENEKAKSHRGSVTSCLVNNFGCYELKETGSFGNGTGVRHYSDSDYFAVCPGEKLSDNSITVLRRFKEALQSTFPKTENILVTTPAVRIPFGYYQSETLEVTPCTFDGLVDTPVGMKPRYGIADGNGYWMKSSPDAHNAYVNREDKRLNGKLKPLIQLVKAWKFFNSVPIKSFYLELRVTKYAETENSIIYNIDVHNIMKILYSGGLASIYDPMGVSGTVRACDTDAQREDALSKTKTGYSRAENAWEKRDTDLDECYKLWRLYYGGNFPTR